MKLEKIGRDWDASVMAAPLVPTAEGASSRAVLPGLPASSTGSLCWGDLPWPCSRGQPPGDSADSGLCPPHLELSTGLPALWRLWFN